MLTGIGKIAPYRACPSRRCLSLGFLPIALSGQLCQASQDISPALKLRACLSTGLSPGLTRPFLAALPVSSSGKIHYMDGFVCELFIDAHSLLFVPTRQQAFPRSSVHQGRYTVRTKSDYSIGRCLAEPNLVRIILIARSDCKKSTAGATLALCCSADVSHKTRLHVMGKYKNQKILKNRLPSSRGVQY